MIRPKTKRILVRRTATELIAMLQRRVDRPDDLTVTGRPMANSSLYKDRDSFNSCETAEKFLQLYKFGWKKGRDTLKNNMADMVQKNKLVLDTAVKGFCVSVPDYLSGNPENMFNMEYTNQKCIDIVVPVGANSGTDAETLLTYVGAIMTVMQSIINSGYKASLKIVSATNYYSKIEIMYLTDIVSEGDILDLDKVACCFHSDFYRRAEFAAEEVDSIAGDIVNRLGYGSAEQWGKEAMLKLAPDLKQDTLYFPAMDTRSGGNQDVLKEAMADVIKILNPTKRNT